MDKHFKVIVNNSYEFNLNKEQALNFNAVHNSENQFQILQNNKSFKAKLIRSDFDKKQYHIIVNSNTYQINIKNSLDQLIKEIGYTSGSSIKLNLISAPMPGIIIDIKVKEGDLVKEGDTLIILEAMKMENAIISLKNAKIKSILIKRGDTVEKNKLLIELE